jgi:adenosylcobinamide hydrolase
MEKQFPLWVVVPRSGSALRACVRDALRASLEAAYADDEFPTSVDDAEHGAVIECEPTVFAP